MRVLIAGVGNIFLTDDGFGPAVLAQFASHPLPDGFRAVDFGIRGVHLAYELLDGYDVLVIVDAAPRGEAPGTVTLVEVDPTGIGVPQDGPMLDAHGMEPVAVLRTLGALGGRVDRVFVLACEPAVTAEGLGLTRVVAATLAESVRALRRLVEQLNVEAMENVGTSAREVRT